MKLIFSIFMICFFVHLNAQDYSDKRALRVWESVGDSTVVKIKRNKIEDIMELEKLYFSENNSANESYLIRTPSYLPKFIPIEVAKLKK